MNIHEYQAKQLLKKYGVPVLPGGVAYTADEAAKVAEGLPAGVYVVKAQIHAGGRGKGTFKEAEAGGKGGVRVVKTIAEVKEAAGQMIGKTLVTHQSGPAGKKVKRVYVEAGCPIERELYLSMLVDRATSRVTLMVSTEGGMNIEDVAHNTPEKIIFQGIDPATGIQGFHCRKIAFALGLKGNQIKSCTKLLTSLYKGFLDSDAALLEINPLVVTGEDVLPLDAKMNFDSN
ncbi:MAG: ATP-grasp domain-containing protein, partial [Rhodospirillaceae bacterium]